MPVSYETTIFYDYNKKILEKIMEEAVEQYVDSHTRVVYPVDRHNSSITVRIPRYQGAGEVLKISVVNKGFRIVSKSIVSSHKFAWGANKREVKAMCRCIENAFQQSSLDLA